MKIVRLRTKLMHGSLDLDISFNDRLNLLVGINGCGKTSALNAVDWLIKKDFANLCHADYEELSVEFRLSGKNYTLSATKNERSMLLNLYQGGEKTFEPIDVRLKFFQDEPGGGFEANNSIRPEEHEIPLWRFLDGLPGLTVISLDRTITAEINDITYTDRSYRRDPRAESISPMGYVSKLTAAAYSEFRKQSITNDSDLKSKIVMSSLQSPSDGMLQGEGYAQQLDEYQVKELEKTVVGFLSRTFQHEHEEVETKTRSFFEYIAGLSVSESGDPTDFKSLVQAQYARIGSLALAFNEFENANTSAFVGLRSYLDSVNRFFIDSHKELLFDEGMGTIFFRYINSDGTFSDNRKISYLSSGEKQVLFLFTLVAYAALEDSVFIVDEPELSLHPKWQHDFMDALLNLCPEGTQLLLATHSPEIVGSHKSACVTIGR